MVLGKDGGKDAIAEPAVIYKEEIVENFFDKIIEVPVEKQVIKEVEREVFVERQIERIVEVPVQVERIVEVEVPYEKIVYVQKEVYRDVYKDVPVPVQMSNERVVIKEVLVPVEVIKEVPVPVERVVYKEVLVPVENSSVAKHERSHTFHETYETMRPAQYEHRSVISEEVRPSQYMTSEHIRSPQSTAHYQSSPLSSAHYGSVGRRVGLGLVLEKTGAGISIKDLVPGLAAERSGQCRRGDGLLAIDGRSLQNYDLDQVKTLTIGDEGSSCSIVVLREGREYSINLTRSNA